MSLLGPRYAPISTDVQSRLKIERLKHFVNAVVEMDRSRLAKVAILRLCGPFSKHAPPGIDWPESLRALICSHYALLKGGLEGLSPHKILPKSPMSKEVYLVTPSS